MDKTIRLWDVRSGKSTATIQTRGEGLNLTWSPDGKTIICGCKTPKVGCDELMIVDVATNKVQRYLRFHYIVNEMGWDKERSLFFVSTGNGDVEIRRWPDLKVVSISLYLISLLQAASFDCSAPGHCI